MLKSDGMLQDRETHKPPYIARELSLSKCLPVHPLLAACIGFLVCGIANHISSRIVAPFILKLKPTGGGSGGSSGPDQESA